MSSSEAILAQAAAILEAHRRDLSAEAVVVSFGSHAPTVSASIDHFTVTIEERGASYSAAAKRPLDAVALAKGKAHDAREAAKRKAEKARGEDRTKKEAA